jgi:hypothetical protein
MGSSGCRAEPRPAADGLQRLLLPRIIVALFFPRVRLSPVISTHTEQPNSVTLHALLRYFLQIIWRSNEPQVSMLGV